MLELHYPMIQFLIIGLIRDELLAELNYSTTAFK